MFFYQGTAKGGRIRVEAALVSPGPSHICGKAGQQWRKETVYHMMQANQFFEIFYRALRQQRGKIEYQSNMVFWLAQAAVQSDPFRRHHLSQRNGSRTVYLSVRLQTAGNVRN